MSDRLGDFEIKVGYYICWYSDTFCNAASVVISVNGNEIKTRDIYGVDIGFIETHKLDYVWEGWKVEVFKAKDDLLSKLVSEEL